MRSLVPLSGIVFLVALGACSANDGSGDSDFAATSGGSGSGASSSGGSSQGSGATGSGGTFIGPPPGGSGQGGSVSTCNPTSDDFDQDGFTIAQGDCNDCDANANPGAFDVPGNGVDEDCNDTPDDEPTGCDGAIPDVGYADPFAGAQAMGICRQSDGTSWGVVNAAYVMADGSAGPPVAVAHGILQSFGSSVNPQEGGKFLTLSSGTARTPGLAGYVAPSDGAGLLGGASHFTSSNPPQGFPIDSPACPDVTTAGGPANDPIALQLELKVPTNAQSFSFNFNFYTAEYPNYICQQYNDFFVVLQNPAPPNAIQSNISFDSQGNSVSVNNGFLEVCNSGTHGGKNFPCTRGPGELQGTGFQGRAATGWLQTVSPVEPGSTIQLRFAIWDAGDTQLDSTVLIDNFQFSVEEAEDAETVPIPTPK